MKMNQIPGEVFRTCYLTEADYEAGWKNSMFYVEKDYLREYQKHKVAMSHVASIAKSFIINNWTKISDWSDLDIIITHGPSGETTEYYNYTPMKSFHTNSKTMKEVWASLDESNKLKHNPIVSVDSIVLDPTDGDFSITINGKEHWWIMDEEVILIADYIETKLNPTHNENA